MTAPFAGQPGHGSTAFARNQPARIADGRIQAGSTVVLLQTPAVKKLLAWGVNEPRRPRDAGAQRAVTERVPHNARFALAKFRPTTLPTTLLTRPTLLGRLEAGASQRLTVVVGSAGTGKSVLLSSWAATRDGGVTSWLSCDEADADPVRFWAGFIQAPQAVAPGFGADAAELLAMDGDMAAENGLVRHMARENFRQIAVQAARSAYFYMHGSASFVDKTPGVKMISAAPFLVECFPDSRFIFQRRNPVANVRSRLVKFGGKFEEHCRDWAAAMNEWLRVRSLLPHYVEIQQEDMGEDPERVARVLAEYIGVPESADQICESLKTDHLERTGAGAGATDKLQAGWTAEQLRAFDRICGPAMQAFGYE
jgi:hypothetical protein